jgi:hypothetical protein
LLFPPDGLEQPVDQFRHDDHAAIPQSRMHRRQQPEVEARGESIVNGDHEEREEENNDIQKKLILTASSVRSLSILPASPAGISLVSILVPSL